MGKKWYAVRKGRKIGIFEDWATCEKQVKGYGGAEFKSFASKVEAEAFLNQQTHAAPAPSQTAASAGKGKLPSSMPPPSTITKASGNGRGTKRQRSDSSEPPPAFKVSNQPQQLPRQQQANSTSPAAIGKAPASCEQELTVAVYFDGGSRGNPGRAGYGYAVINKATNETIRLGCRPLPYGSTNNEAEYTGMIQGLKCALDTVHARQIAVIGDSELVVKQMKGVYRVKSPKLQCLFEEAKALQARCTSFNIQHVYRDQNKLADQLSNLAMDTDAVVDEVVVRYAGGADRALLAGLLAREAQVDKSPDMVNKLRTADSFLLAAAEMLGPIWDGMPTEQVIAWLTARDWDEETGGPPVAALPAVQARGRSSGVVAAGVVTATSSDDGSCSGKGMQAVPVAPATLGESWASEIRRQEQIMQQQQQQAAVASSFAGNSVSTALAQQMAHVQAATRQHLCHQQQRYALIGPSASLHQDGRQKQRVLHHHQQRLMPSAVYGYAAASSSTLVANGRIRRGQQQHLQQPVAQQLISIAKLSSRVWGGHGGSAGSMRSRAVSTLVTAAVVAERLCTHTRTASGGGRHRSPRAYA